MFFWPNSKKYLKMAKRCFLGLKRIQKLVLGLIFFATLVKKCPKKGQKLLSRPEGSRGIRLRIFFGKIGQKKSNGLSCFLDL